MSEKRPCPRSPDYDDGVYPDENRGSGIRLVESTTLPEVTSSHLHRHSASSQKK